MGIKKKMTAWFLVLVMVCSMFVGVPVSATEGENAGQGESVTGFVMSTGFQWDDDGMITGVDNLNRKEEWANNANWLPFAFGIYTDEEVIEPVSWENIQIEVNTGTAEEPEYEVTEEISYRGCDCVSDSVWETGVSVYELKFPEAEFGETVEYRFSCVDGNEGEYVSFYYQAKPFGFYLYETPGEENGNGTDYLNKIYYSPGNENDTTFYMLPYTDDENCTLSAGENPFEGTVWDSEGNSTTLDMSTYFDVTELDEDSNSDTFEGYKIQLKSDVWETATVELMFNGNREWKDEESGTWEEYITISPGIDNDFLLVHDENCDMGTDIQTIRYSKEDNSEVGEIRYLVDCAIDEHGDRYIAKYYKTSALTVYKIEYRWDEESGTEVPKRKEVTNVVTDVTDNNGNNSLYFTFEEEGNYVITMGESLEREISVYANAWNEFYLSTDPEAKAVWEFSTTGSEDDSTLYFIAKDLEDKSLDSVDFSAYVDGQKVSDEDNYFTVTPPALDENGEGSTEKIYTIEITAKQSFELVADSQMSNEFDTWGKSNSIWIEYKATGLVLGEPVWGVVNEETKEEGYTGAIEEGAYAKSKGGEALGFRWVYLGMAEIDENGKMKYTPVDSSAFYASGEDENEVPPAISINGQTDYTVMEQEQWPLDDSNYTVIVRDDYATNGIYGFYVGKDTDLVITYGEEAVTITRELPCVGFYTSETASFGTLIKEHYWMNDTNMYKGMDIYVLPREDVKGKYSYQLETIDNTIQINDETFNYVHIQEEGHAAGCYQSADTYTEPIKVRVSECSGSFLRLKGNIKWDEDRIEYCEQYVGLTYDRGDKAEPIIVEDGKPHEGFAGCLITKSDYNVSQWWMMSGDVYYWVHADTIQGVVDELSKVAKEKKVTVDGVTYTLGDGMRDYIWLNTSYFQYSEEFANSEQHVVTPSNIKGIIMQAEAEMPYALYDNGTIKGYYQVSEWTNDKETLFLTQPGEDQPYYMVRKLDKNEAETQKADYVVSDYSKSYTVVEDEEGNRYIEYENEDFVENVDEYGNAKNAYNVYHPNLYVDATVEVKIIGSFGDSSANKKVQLGFYEGSTNKSIINGQEFSANDIGREYTVKSGTVGDDTENIVTVIVKEFKASTECSKASINGENCEVTLDGENASLRDKIDIYQKGDDDYADAKELAEGKPLKVKLDVNEAKEDDAEAKKVKEQVEKDCNKDKTKPSKVQYLDIDMKYQVGNRDPKAVTETMEEVDITMDIPDSFQQTGKHAKKRRYKVYRYHDGKVDKLDAEFDKDKKKLHFKTDKFSTYALVAEDVVATGIEVTANPSKLSYVEGEMFDTTGMTISLVYSDGTKEAVTGYTVSATNALALTDKTVTIAYEEFTVQVPITVLAGASSGEGSKEEAPQTPQVVLPSIGATAATTNGDCKVTAIGLDGAVEVTFTPSKKNKKAKKVTIDKTVTIDGKEYAVTAIADNAFSGNTKMTSVSIPDTVTKIGSNAFKGCTKLKKVTIPKSVTEIGKNAFYNCKKVTKVTIKSDSLEVIGAGAFRKCSSLKSVTIPEGVTEIGKDAFRDCKKLSKITIKSTKLTKVGKNAFKNIAKKPTIKVPKSKKKDYKKMLKKAGYTKTVK